MHVKDFSLRSYVYSLSVDTCRSTVLQRTLTFDIVEDTVYIFSTTCSLYHVCDVFSHIMLTLNITMHGLYSCICVVIFSDRMR